MKIVFIAGPYSAPTIEGRQANIAQAEIYARALARLRIGFCCPHLNSREMDDEAPYEFFLDMTIATMKRCDAALAIPGWEESRGARLEVATAKWEKIPVFQPRDITELAELEAWAKS